MFKVKERMVTVKLFCFPHAGGSASIYLKWNNVIGDNLKLEIIPLEYKGHGVRMDEDFYVDFNEMAEDMLRYTLNKLSPDEPFMLFGHSMGAYVAFKIANLLEEKDIFASHLFLSGRATPCFWTEQKKKISGLPDDEFMKEIISYGGIEREYHDCPEILDFLLEILRNDFRIIETIDNNSVFLPVKSNISIMNGYDDGEITQERVAEWEKYTDGNCKIKFYEGGHFYLNDNLNEICNYILQCCG